MSGTQQASQEATGGSRVLTLLGQMSPRWSEGPRGRPLSWVSSGVPELSACSLPWAIPAFQENQGWPGRHSTEHSRAASMVNENQRAPREHGQDSAEQGARPQGSSGAPGAAHSLVRAARGLLGPCVSGLRSVGCGAIGTRAKPDYEQGAPLPDPVGCHKFPGTGLAHPRWVT